MAHDAVSQPPAATRSLPAAAPRPQQRPLTTSLYYSLYSDSSSSPLRPRSRSLPPHPQPRPLLPFHRRQHRPPSPSVSSSPSPSPSLSPQPVSDSSWQRRHSKRKATSSLRPSPDSTKLQLLQQQQSGSPSAPSFPTKPTRVVLSQNFQQQQHTARHPESAAAAATASASPSFASRLKAHRVSSRPPLRRPSPFSLPRLSSAAVSAATSGPLSSLLRSRLLSLKQRLSAAGSSSLPTSPSAFPMMDALSGLGFDADKVDDSSGMRPMQAAASQALSRGHKASAAAEDDMQVIDISEDSDSDGMAAIGDDGADDDSCDFLHRPLSPSNPFLVICNSLCSSPSSAASIHVHPSSLSLPPPSKQDTRIPLSSLPDELRCFLIAQQYALVRDCEAEGGLLPSWMTADHVKLLSQLFDKHVKSEWEEMERGREGAREREERAEREEAQQAAGGPSMKEKEASMRGAEKLKTATGSVSTSQASSSISSSSSFCASSSSQQQPAPIYSLITASDPNGSSAPPSSPHASSYTPPRQLPSTPVPPPLLSPSLSKQTSRIAETIRRLYGLSSEEKGHKLLGHSCLTGDHRVLTRGGWQSIARVQKGDEVLSFNIATYAQEWKPVTDVQAYARDRHDRNDGLYRMQGSGMDVIATRDHRMLSARFSSGTANGLQVTTPVGYETVGELLGLTHASSTLRVRGFVHNRTRSVICAGFNLQPAVKIVIPGLEQVCDWWWQQDGQLAFLQFLGFWLRDGHLAISTSSVCIGQRKELALDWLEPLLRTAFPRCYRNVSSADPDQCMYSIRCPPLCDYLRLMAAGPIGYNPRDPAELRSYPHFTKDEGLATKEQQSVYFRPSNALGSEATWTEAAMLAAMRGDGVGVAAMEVALKTPDEDGDISEVDVPPGTASAIEDPALAQQLQEAGKIVWWNGGQWIIIDGQWFHLKRWLGDQAQIANVYSQLSRQQAAALLDGFCRADGKWERVQYDGSGEPTGQWKCDSSSFPLIDHLMLIGQLAGAAVDLSLHPKAGKTTTVDSRPVSFSVDHWWELVFLFNKAARRPMQTAPLAQPVDVSDDRDGRGYYQYDDDGMVYDISVQGNFNFLTQRLSIKRINSGVTNTGVKAHSVFVGNCLTSEDQSLASEHKSDLLYGEVLPEGVSRMFDSDHLDLLSARTVYDLGSGLGKLAMQAYLQFPHLDWVCGVELARSRSMKGFEAVRKLSKLRLSGGLDGAGGGGGGNGGQFSSSGVVEEGKDGQHIRLTETMTSTTHSYSKCLGRSKKKQKHRYLELRCADLFTVQEAAAADVVVCETKFPEEKYRDLAVFLSHFKASVRVLTYEDLDVVYSYCHMLNPYIRYENNHVNDRFYTTWAPNYGYRFHLWRKRGDGGAKPMEEEKREEKQFKQE